MLLNIPHYRAAVSTETLYLYVVLVPPLDIPHSFPCVDVASQKSIPISPKFDHSEPSRGTGERLTPSIVPLYKEDPHDET